MRLPSKIVMELLHTSAASAWCLRRIIWRLPWQCVAPNFLSLDQKNLVTLCAKVCLQTSNVIWTSTKATVELHTVYLLMRGLTCEGCTGSRPSPYPKASSYFTISFSFKHTISLGEHRRLFQVQRSGVFSTLFWIFFLGRQRLETW